MSADVTDAVLARAREHLRGRLAAHELGAAEVEVVGRLDRLRAARRRARTSPLAPTTWNAGRSPSGRIGSTLADVWTSSRRTQQRGVDAVALEQRDAACRRRRRCRSRPRSAPSAPSLASTSAVPPAEPAAVIADLLDELAALALGDRLHRPHEHVEHVHAERDAPSLVARSSPRRVVRSRARARPRPPPAAAPRRARAARRSRRRASRPSHAHSSSTRRARPPRRGRRRRRPRRGWPSAPRVVPSSASSTAAASSGVPNVAYGATRHGAAEQQHLVVDARAARRARSDSAVAIGACVWTTAPAS